MPRRSILGEAANTDERGKPERMPDSPKSRASARRSPHVPMNPLRRANYLLPERGCQPGRMAYGEETGELVVVRSSDEPFHVLRFIADGNAERTGQPPSAGRRAERDNRSARASAAAWAAHRRTWRAHRRPSSRRPLRAPIAESPRYSRPRGGATSRAIRSRIPHDDEFELTQTVVGPRLECRRQNPLQRLVRNRLCSKIPDGPAVPIHCKNP